MVFWTLLIGCAIAAWAMLRTLGGEREWRLRELEYRLATERRRQEDMPEVAGRINPHAQPTNPHRHAA
ncbi:MAG TPA: hypothetical protein PKB10_15660 [Tepidisphaeraceae bacterium]|nr:hypothetical protein [Tepidisphaeraceae bacterium]